MPDKPSLCYILVPGEPGKRIGIVKRGERGYYLTDLDDGSLPTKANGALSVEGFVWHMNARLGVDRDLHGALENFDRFRSQIESAASRKFDRNGFDPDKYEGMPAIRLITNGLT